MIWDLNLLCLFVFMLKIERVCVCVRAYMRACVCVCARVRTCAYMLTCTHNFECACVYLCSREWESKQKPQFTFLTKDIYFTMDIYPCQILYNLILFMYRWNVLSKSVTTKFWPNITNLALKNWCKIFSVTKCCWRRCEMKHSKIKKINKRKWQSHQSKG